MNLSEIRLSFQILEKIMNLPPDAKVVAVQEEDTNGVFKIRVVSLRDAPEDFSFDELSMVGDAYRHPEKYKKKDKAFVRGYSDEPEPPLLS